MNSWTAKISTVVGRTNFTLSVILEDGPFLAAEQTAGGRVRHACADALPFCELGFSAVSATESAPTFSSSFFLSLRNKFPGSASKLTPPRPLTSVRVITVRIIVCIFCCCCCCFDARDTL